MSGCLCILVPASSLYHTSSHTAYNNIKAYVFNLQVGLITTILILKKVRGGRRFVRTAGKEKDRFTLRSRGENSCVTLFSKVRVFKCIINFVF